MRRLVVAVGLAVLLSGCGYTTSTPWRDNVDTVAVPVFENLSLRREHEFALTKAVSVELMKRTGYRIASKKDADTVLLGTIIEIRSPVLTEDSQDEVFEITVSVVLELTWQDQRTGEVLFEGRVSESGDAVVRAGQNRETAGAEALEELAQAVVDRLLRPW
jgi:hypothetical protein